MAAVPTWEDSTEVAPMWEESTAIEASAIPTWEESTTPEEEEGFRAPKGFAETILNPVDAIKEHGIISNLVKNYFTPQEEYDKQKTGSKKDTINSVPAL